jgi:uncharacterized membrane protein
MLEPGESTFFDLQVTVPPGPPAGIGTTIVSAQSGWDADYQAQLATTTVRSDPAVGLGESVAAGAPGSLVTHTLVITNHGNLTDSYSLSTQPGLWNCQVTVGSTGVLSPAQSEPVQLQVAIPHQMAGRTVIASDQCLLTATSQLSSSITGIGIAWTHAVVAPGLVLTSASDQLTGMPGGTLTYTLAMTNTGTYWGAFELAVDGEFWPTRVSPEETPPVQPGQRYEVAVAVTIPFATNLTSDAATVRAVSGWDAAVWREIPLVTRRLWVTFLPLAVR